MNERVLVVALDLREQLADVRADCGREADAVDEVGKLAVRPRALLEPLPYFLQLPHRVLLIQRRDAAGRRARAAAAAAAGAPPSDLPEQDVRSAPRRRVGVEPLELFQERDDFRRGDTGAELDPLDTVRRQPREQRVGQMGRTRQFRVAEVELLVEPHDPHRRPRRRKRLRQQVRRLLHVPLGDDVIQAVELAPDARRLDREDRLVHVVHHAARLPWSRLIENEKNPAQRRRDQNHLR